MSVIGSQKVSIGMPVYNGQKYLTEALESILSQTYENFEVIVSDNASTDATEEICKDYVQSDSRIRYYRNSENIGASRNYRRAFELANGAYFRWANYDDLFATESLARCVDILDSDPSVVLVYPKTRLIDEDGEVIGDYEDGLNLQSPSAIARFSQVWEKAGMINVIYGLIRSEVLRKTALLGDFPASDKPFVAELSLYGKFLEIPDYLFFRRVHPDAYSSQQSNKKILEFYNPNTSSKYTMTQCRHLWEAFSAVRRAPLGRSEKIKLFRHVIRMARWNRRSVASEVLCAARYTIIRR